MLLDYLPKNFRDFDEAPGPLPSSRAPDGALGQRLGVGPSRTDDPITGPSARRVNAHNNSVALWLWLARGEENWCRHTLGSCNAVLQLLKLLAGNSHGRALCRAEAVDKGKKSADQ